MTERSSFYDDDDDDDDISSSSDENGNEAQETEANQDRSRSGCNLA